MSKPENPPLFNVIHAKAGDLETNITLGDLFAMVALPYALNREDTTLEADVTTAYEIADLMLAEREKRDAE